MLQEIENEYQAKLQEKDMIIKKAYKTIKEMRIISPHLED